MKTQAEELKDTERIQRNPSLEDSFFCLTLSDDSVIKDVSWSSISEQILVQFMDHQKTVLVCKMPVKKITVQHEGLKVEMEIEKDEQVYQSMRSEASYLSDGTTEQKVIGRVVGKIKNGRVIEEKILDSRINEIIGIKT